MRRLANLDILRGFALCGIILINIMQLVNYNLDKTPLDENIQKFLYFAVEQRFYVIFAFLFGVGFHIFITRAEARGDRPLIRFTRRLVILLLIGIIHHYFQPGEALLVYAILGFFLIPVHRAKPWVSLLLALIIIGGSAFWLGIAQLETLGMFFLGKWTGQIGLFAEPKRYRKGLRITQVTSLLLIWPLHLLGNRILDQTGLVDTASTLSGLPVSVFYVTTLTLLLRHQRIERLLTPLGNLGRMALTNYLSQTAMILLLSYLLHWPSQVHITVLMISAVFILIIQMIISSWWLSRFSMGPVEYVWRLATYGKKQRQTAAQS
ncbi:DUF418 domain-containing protein [Paenibacillus wulumuqiensis]|uniref:DUF418 domain-containing protein n=1 Tax=Paenibacillus wulumuqiensis TaxID=1567107 RepID=UPI0006193A3D|nr:DUF418 domain-containing protein [Paenibacillus wulumuqiensis]